MNWFKRWLRSFAGIDWQPIATCPLDNVRVLLWCSVDEYACIGSWSGDRDPSSYGHFTHWAPLTPPEGK